MNRKIFIFDLDGVIVDTAKFHFEAWQRLAQGLDIRFRESDNEQLKGVSRVDSLKKILHWGDKTLGQDEFDRQLHAKNEDYLKQVETLQPKDMLPGVHNFLNELADRQLPMALGSASKNARLIIDKLEIKHHFDVIVDGTDVSKAKPDPEVFTNACDALNIDYGNAIVFEDSQAGIKAANNAGMYSVGIGSDKVLSEANEVFTGFDQMPEDYIDQLLKK